MKPAVVLKGDALEVERHLLEAFRDEVLQQVEVERGVGGELSSRDAGQPLADAGKLVASSDLGFTAWVRQPAQRLAIAVETGGHRIDLLEEALVVGDDAGERTLGRVVLATGWGVRHVQDDSK